MFYMFSGPDFLYANAFYPKATTYVLSALEPPGSVPDLTKLPRGGVGAALASVEHSLGSILSFSFFITKKMKIDLHEGQLNGAMPLLYVFLARSGKTIKNVSTVALDDKGTAYFANDNRRRQRDAGRADRVCGKRWRRQDAVLFLDRSVQLRRQVERLPEVLRHARAGQQPDQERVVSSAFRQLLDGARLHSRQQRNASFRTIPESRSAITAPKKWRFFPFGRYAGPIDKFPGQYQQSYAELFRRAQPMDFGIGYRWRSHESNLLLSVRLAGRWLGDGWSDDLVHRAGRALRRTSRARASLERRRHHRPMTRRTDFSGSS